MFRKINIYYLALQKVILMCNLVNLTSKIHTYKHTTHYSMVRFWGCRCCWIPGAAHPVGVLVERVDEALPVNAPHFDRLVVRRCHQSLAIMGESNTAYSGSVGFEHFWLPFSRVHRHITTNTTENTTSLKHAAQPQLACDVWPLTDTSNCAQQGHLFYISYYSPIMGHIILLSKQRSPD